MFLASFGSDLVPKKKNFSRIFNLTSIFLFASACPFGPMVKILRIYNSSFKGASKLQPKLFLSRSQKHRRKHNQHFKVLFFKIHTEN